MKGGLVLLGALLAGCAPASAPSAGPASSSPAVSTEAPGGPSLEPLERRLLAAHSLKIHARIASDGVVPSHFEGTLLLGEGQQVRLAMQGDLGSRPTDLTLFCDGKTMRGGSKEKPFELPAPPGLREALVIAFTRMGLLHDLALLSEGRAPAQVDGTVREGIQAVGVTKGAGESIRGRMTEHWRWNLVVQGGSTSPEDVWMDGAGVPIRRRLVVHFPEGDMHVGEEYDEVTMDAPVDPATFAIPAGGAP